MLTAKDLQERYGMTEDELEDLNQSAKAYEKGEWPAGRATRVGRPRLAGEEVRPITVRLPVSQIVALDAKAKHGGETRSAAVRDALDQWLAQAQ